MRLPWLFHTAWCLKLALATWNCCLHVLHLGFTAHLFVCFGLVAWASLSLTRQYLVESIRKFPDQLEFAGMIERAGFSNVTHENMTFGVVAAHSGFKPLMAPGR